MNVKDNSFVSIWDINSTQKFSNETHYFDYCYNFCYDDKEYPKPYNYISGNIYSDKCIGNEFFYPI